MVYTNSLQIYETISVTSYSHFQNAGSMTNSKPYYLSEDIYPQGWESITDAYNDLAEYAYNRIEHLSNRYPIPEEYVGDAVLKACERAFKYSYSYDETLGKIHNWFNLILKNVIHDIYNKLPKEQSLDHVLNRDIEDHDFDVSVHDDCQGDDGQCDGLDEGETSECDNVEMGASPEYNMVYEEVQKIRKEVANALKTHVDNLKPIDREIFVKAYLEDIPFKVIAEELGMTETGTRKRAFDIKKRIRHVLPQITPWKITDMVLYNKVAEPEMVPVCYPMQDILLKLYPQYDTSEIDWDEIDDMDLERDMEVHALLTSYLEMCFDDYKKDSSEASIDYAALVSELQRRGRTITEKSGYDAELCVVEDDLDIVIGTEPTLMIHIGFVHEFMPIVCSGTDAKSVADFIDDLHELLDRAGEEIDSIIDTRIEKSLSGLESM